ncbi:MAG: hypothetical protein K8R11_02585 [Methanococcoides sp.]|nr:hypothetical protein [Methanococcoides sp.]
MSSNPPDSSDMSDTGRNCSRFNTDFCNVLVVSKNGKIVHKYKLAASIDVN